MRTLVLSLANATRVLALAATASALVIAIVLYEDGISGEDVVAVLVALAPPVMLWILWGALRELAELPDRLRQLPETARVHGQDLQQLAGELRTPGKRFFRLPLILWRLRGVGDLVRPHAAILPFLSVWFLTLSALAAFAAVAEVAIAFALLIADAM
jgi:hypothetical protein